MDLIVSVPDHCLSFYFDVSDAGLVLSAVKLNQIFYTIDICNMKKAHNSDQEDHTKKPHVYHFCIEFKGCDLWLLTPSAFFAHSNFTDLKDDSCNFMVS